MGRLVLLHGINCSGTYSSRAKIHGHDGNARNLFDLVTNQQQAHYDSVSSSKRSNDVSMGVQTHPEAISYNSVSESENEMDFRIAEPDRQNRIDNPEFTDCFLGKVFAK